MWKSLWSIEKCGLLPDGCVYEQSCCLLGTTPQARGHQSNLLPSLLHQTKKLQTCSELLKVCVYFWASFVHFRCKRVLFGVSVLIYLMAKLPWGDIKYHMQRFFFHLTSSFNDEMSWILLSSFSSSWYPPAWSSIREPAAARQQLHHRVQHSGEFHVRRWEVCPRWLAMWRTAWLFRPQRWKKLS